VIEHAVASDVYFTAAVIYERKDVITRAQLSFLVSVFNYSRAAVNVAVIEMWTVKRGEKWRHDISSTCRFAEHIKDLLYCTLLCFTLLYFTLLYFT
jgi:hypothetical protein